MTGTAKDADTAYGYELTALVNTPHLLDQLSGSPVDDNRLLLNTYLEAHLLHGLVLTSFFLPGRRMEDDITAADFTGTDWQPKGPEVDRLRKTRHSLDKRLAHLTRTRHTDFEGYRSIIPTGDLMVLNTELLSQLATTSPASLGWFDRAATAADVFTQEFGDAYLATLRALDLATSLDE